MSIFNYIDKEHDNSISDIARILGISKKEVSYVLISLAQMTLLSDLEDNNSNMIKELQRNYNKNNIKQFRNLSKIQDTLYKLYKDSIDNIEK